MTGLASLVAQLAPVEQAHLLEARQMQALSFAVHIPLVCFGIAFPSLVLLVEWLHLRTGDPLYRTLARRWSKVMLALFAVGAVTGTILSFEMGLLWPGFMAAFGDVFGLGFALEGFSFFVEAIFIAIYVYGWDRLSPRALPVRHPDRHRGLHRLVDGDLRQRVDAEPDWLPAARGRPGRRRRAGQGAICQPLPVAAAHPHVRRRLSRRRLPGGRGIRRAPVPRRSEPVRAHRAQHPAHGRGNRGAGA